MAASVAASLVIVATGGESSIADTQRPHFPVTYYGPSDLPTGNESIPSSGDGDENVEVLNASVEFDDKELTIIAGVEFDDSELT